MIIATAPDPAVSRHRLGTELRQLRRSRALRMTDVADQLGIAPSTLSRIETGKTPTRASYIRVLLDLYDVTDAEQRRELTDLATHGQQDDWCSEAARLLPSETLRYYGLEAAATRIQAFAGAVIPGLLCTPEYAAATWRTSRPGLTHEDAATLAYLTRHRRSAFDDGRHRLHAVIDESALLRPAGTPEVMAGQLAYLARAAATAARITIQVLPLNMPWPVLAPPFTILTFPDRTAPTTACTATVDGRPALTASALAISVHHAAFDALTQAALPATQSGQFIDRLARQATSGPPAGARATPC